MPPPASYIDIDTIPFSRVVTVAEFTVDNKIWFRYVATEEICLGGYTPRATTVFIPRTKIYASDGTTLLHTIPNPSSTALSWFFVFPAGTYFVLIENIGSSGPGVGADFTSEYDTRPILTTVTSGSLIINDDTDGFPAVVMQMDGTVDGVLTQIPAGEIGDALPTGEMIWHDDFNDPVGSSRFLLFATDLSLTATVDIVRPAINFPLACHDATTFWVLLKDKVYSITPAGTVSAVIATVTHTNASAIGISPDSTILYYTRGTTNGIVYRWDLVNDVALSNLYTVPDFTTGDGDYLALTGNGNPGEIIALSDGSIVTWRYKGADDSFQVLHISAAGALINSWPYASTNVVNHLHFGLDDPSSVRGWNYESFNGREGHFYALTLADGTESESGDTDMFGQGINLHRDSNVKFAPSNSCAMVTYLYETEPPPDEGGDNRVECVHGSNGIISTLSGSYLRTFLKKAGSQGVVSTLSGSA